MQYNPTLKKSLNRVIMLCFSIWCIGALFRIQHWPYGRMMLTIADFLLFALFAFSFFLPDNRARILQIQSKLTYGGAAIVFGNLVVRQLNIRLNIIVLQIAMIMLVAAGILYVVALFTHKRNRLIPSRFVKLPPIEVLELELESYLGTYFNAQLPLHITFTKEANQLIGQATDQMPFPLQAIGSNLFRYDVAGLVIEFDATGESMVLYQHGGEFVFGREAV